MPLKKTVAMERRIDLASLFCLIARHGPAVLVTLVVIGCSLAGFIMFRNMREKRRRRAAAGADRRDSHAGHRDEALGLGEDEEPCAEVEESRRGSTDASDEEHAYHSHVRHRRASPERNPYKDELHDGDTAVNRSSYAFFWNRCSPKATESHADTRYNSERSYSHPSTEGVTEDICGAKEPELINDVGYEEKEKVIEADSSEDITSTAEDVSEEEFALEEESVQFTFNSQLCSSPTPTLSANDSKEKSKESNIKQEYELENNIAPILKQDEIPSASCTENQEVTLDQVHNTLQQNLPVQSGKPAAMPNLNYKEQADISCNDNTVSTTLSVEVMGKDLVETIESEQLKLVDTKGDSLASTDDIVVADLSSNSQQTEPPISPTFDSEINKNGLCLQKLSHFESDNSSNHKDIELVNTVCPKATSDDCKNISDLEAVSYSHDVNMAEGKSVAHQEMTEKVETETSLLSEDTSAEGQNHQCQEMLPQGQNGNRAMNNLSDPKDSICDEKQTLPICEEKDLNILGQKEGQSSHIDPMHGQCSVHPPTSQSQLYEVMEEETSPSGFATDVDEISTITDLTMQTNYPKQLEGSPDLDSETNLPPTIRSQISENKTNQTCQKDENTVTINISATTREKIESMVEQMVAEVYKDVTQTALEAKPMQLEENISPELVQGNDSIAPDSLPSYEVVQREVIGSNVAVHSTEDIVNSVSCLNNITTVENKVQKDIMLISDALENKNTSVTLTDHSNIVVTEAVSNPQDSIHLEEESVEHLALDKNTEKEISVSEDAYSIQSVVIEVKSTELEKHESLEQLDELAVQPVLDINGTVHDNFANESIVKVVQQETCVEDVCSNMATQMQAETMVTCLDISNVEKVEDEKETQTESDIERKKSESVATSYQFEQRSEQRESEVVLDSDKGLLSNKTETEGGNLLLEKQENVQEIPSCIKAEISENTATSNEVQNEQKESGMLVDTSDNLSNMIVKTSKVVIVCRTAEASVSTVEMSDSEDDVIEGDTSYLEPASFKNSSCQDHTDINRNPTNEEAHGDAVASTSDTLTAQTVIEEVEEKQVTGTGMPLDLTSRVALDIPQYSSASLESIEQVERKDNATCTPSLESGISSMTVSPEKEESSKVLCQDTLTTCQVFAEEKVSCSVLTSDGFVTVTEGDSITLKNGPERSSSPQISPLKEISNDLSLTNEDSFGSEIEDGYHKATEEFMTQVVDNIKSTGVCETKVVVKKLDEKKEQACAANKEKAENLDSEKTEISIMEATMDHNEWITDGNYQMLPWMAAGSFSKDMTSKEAQDVTENKPQAQTSCTEDSVENAKKVLAVQPMPQNVNVTFRVHYVTLTPNQTVAVTGDQPELGAWKSVIPLVKTKDGYWTCVVGLPAESHVEWKFVILEKGEVCRWEECGNRLLYTGYGDDLLVHKWWGFL